MKTDPVTTELTDTATVSHSKKVSVSNAVTMQPPLRQLYSSTQIRDSFLKEVIAMTRFTMSKGKSEIPNHVYSIVELFNAEYIEREQQKSLLKEAYVFDESKALDLVKLVEVHDILSDAIAPATPGTVLLLDPYFAEKSIFSWISPVPLLRYLMIVAFISLNGFILLALSPSINETGGDIFHTHGIELLTNLMFYAFSASLGACFTALFQANNYIVVGTFDPKYAPTYWIRLLVGIMAGLILASLIPIDPHALNGLGKPTLSLIGGFSASLVYRILNLFVGIIEDMVKRMSTAVLGQDKTS